MPGDEVMKYEVVEGPSRGGLGQFFTNRFSVKKNGQIVAFLLNEAEAKLFEFALNTAAENKPLARVNYYTNDGGCPDLTYYEGPTDVVS